MNNDEEAWMAVKTKIEQWMTANNVRESHMSRLAGIGANGVRSILTGASKRPKKVTIEKIARVMDMAPETLDPRITVVTKGVAVARRGLPIQFIEGNNEFIRADVPEDFYKTAIYRKDAFVISVSRPIEPFMPNPGWVIIDAMGINAVKPGDFLFSKYEDKPGEIQYLFIKAENRDNDITYACPIDFSISRPIALEQLQESGFTIIGKISSVFMNL